MSSPEDRLEYITVQRDGYAVSYGPRFVPNYETNGGLDSLRQNTRLMCPICGIMWGLLSWQTFPGYNRGPVRWTCEMRPCESHGDGLLTRIDERLWPIIQDLPTALKRREFRILLNQHTTQRTAPEQIA